MIVPTFQFIDSLPHNMSDKEEETDLSAQATGNTVDNFDNIIKSFEALTHEDQLRLLQRLSGAKPKVEQASFQAGNQPTGGQPKVEQASFQAGNQPSGGQPQPNLGNVQAPQAELDVQGSGQVAANSLDESKIPRLPKFTGVVSKSEPSFRLWRFEVDNLRTSHRDVVVKRAIQKSLSGTAAEVRMRLGSDATVDQILNKLENIFGTVLTKDQLLSDFHSSKQKSNESVAEWSCRLEELLNHPLLLSAGDRNSMLKSKFFSGLQSIQIKNAVRHKFESGSYDELLVSARAAEEEFKSDKAVAKPQVVNPAPDKWDLLVKELREIKGKMSEWESKFKSDSASNTNAASSKQANDSSQITCNYCKKKGHLKKNCVKLLNKKQSAAEGTQ